MMKISIALISLLLVALSAPLALAEGTFEDLPLPAAFFPGQISVNFDGTVLGLNWDGVGTYTEMDGVVYIDAAMYGSYYLTNGGKISGDGSTLTLGVSVDGAPDQAAYWNATDGIVVIPLAEDATDCGGFGSAIGTNYDGTVHVGLGWFNGCDFFAQYWAAGDASASHLPDEGDGARADDVSGDGSTVVGWYYPAGTSQRTACVWQDGVFTGVWPDGSELNAVSYDGTRACGTNWEGAMYWDTTVGAVTIGTLPGDEPWGAFGLDISNDGKVVGQSGNQFFGVPRAFIWTPEDGMMYLGDYLMEQGVTGVEDVHFFTAQGISDDGNTIVGAYVNEVGFLQAFVVRLNGSVGIQDLDDEEVTEDDTPSAATRLVGAYPNPFNPMTSVKFNLDRDQHVRLCVFDMNGRRVAELANQTFGAGEHSVVWQGRDESGRAVASGNYLLRMVTGSGVQTSKMMLVR
jgi:probable HAF family extracellular repeat protein